ncbi:hypothetical protein [Hymenobacter sp. GOD-10R]|uniref:hypothetical protein n=1 Tax=Hymenobacter sp. GOD-10R TaxID=3093922 RepID=UPI002D7A1749|nr:hypothetical protein [Hymenobacter sp. GOD-10R]WRQ27099.1 hypothetical protein SD425_18660 [Hymenobacter sp. GOD-10R]
MCSYYNLAAALEKQRQAEAEEKAPETLFLKPITEITLTTGTESFTVPVNPKTGFLIIHKLQTSDDSKVGVKKQSPTFSILRMLGFYPRSSWQLQTSGLTQRYDIGVKDYPLSLLAFLLKSQENG